MITRSQTGQKPRLVYHEKKSGKIRQQEQSQRKKMHSKILNNRRQISERKQSMQLTKKERMNRKRKNHESSLHGHENQIRNNKKRNQTKKPVEENSIQACNLGRKRRKMSNNSFIHENNNANSPKKILKKPEKVNPREQRDRQVNKREAQITKGVIMTDKKSSNKINNNAPRRKNINLKPGPQKIENQQQFQQQAENIENINKASLKKSLQMKEKSETKNINLKEKIKMVQLKIQKKMQEKQEQSQSGQILLDCLMCPICQDFIAPAREASCGHSFCQICLYEYFLAFDQCPVCDRYIRGNQCKSNKKLDQLIEEFVNTLQENQKKWYKKKLKKAKKYRDNLKVENFEVGDHIDIRDDNYYWHKGIISRIYTKFQDNVRKIRLIDVEYLDVQKKDEVDPNSVKIAKPGTFTDRRDIPKFQNRVMPILEQDLSNEFRYSEQRSSQEAKS